MPFSMFSGYQKFGKNEKILEKVFLVLDIISALLYNLQPVTALISTTGEPSSSGLMITFTVNHKPQATSHNLYGQLKGFVEMTLF